MAKESLKPFFQRLETALHEGIDFAKGNIKLKTTSAPQKPPEVDAQTLIELREKSQMSQAVFAGMLNVSMRTVQDWEQGKRKPSQAALRLIQVFRENPSAVCEIAGVSREHDS